MSAAEPADGRAEPTDLLTLEAVEAAAAHIYAHRGYAPDPVTCPGCELCGPALSAALAERVTGDGLISPRPVGPARPPARRVEVSIDPAARQLMTALYGPTFADEVEGRLAAALPALLADTLTEETP